MRFSMKLFYILAPYLGVMFLCPPPDDPPPNEPTLEELKAQLAAKDAELSKLKKSAAPPPDDEEDDDLLDKTRRSKGSNDADKSKLKSLEGAIKFNMRSEDFLKKNASLLPTEVSEVFAQANKENFDDENEKASAIKAGVVKSFFSLEDNVALLTEGQKTQLAEFLKLTKNGRQEKANQVYEMLFEPAFERLKDARKAEALTKGHGSGDDDAYKSKIAKASRSHYLGDKNA